MYRLFISLYIDKSSTNNVKDYSKILSESVVNALQIFSQTKCDSDIICCQAKSSIKVRNSLYDNPHDLVVFIASLRIFSSFGINLYS